MAELAPRPRSLPLAPHALPSRRRLALALLRERERIVRTHSAPGLPFDHGRFAIVEEPWPDDELARARALGVKTVKTTEETGS